MYLDQSEYQILLIPSVCPVLYPQECFRRFQQVALPPPLAPIKRFFFSGTRDASPPDDIIVRRTAGQSRARTGVGGARELSVRGASAGRDSPVRLTGATWRGPLEAFLNRFHRCSPAKDPRRTSFRTPTVSRRQTSFSPHFRFLKPPIKDVRHGD